MQQIFNELPSQIKELQSIKVFTGSVTEHAFVNVQGRVNKHVMWYLMLLYCFECFFF